MQGTVGCREVLGSLLVIGEQVCAGAGQWAEQRQEVGGADSERHCHSQGLDLPELCQISARNHCELFSFFMGSC